MADKYIQRPICTAPELLLKLVLVGTQSHYESRGMVDDKRLEHLLHAGKQILYKSHQESDVRQNLGFSSAVWQCLTATLSAALPVLERLCFIYRCAQPTTYNNSSSELVAANCFTLVKEIERLNDLCTIARNLLATTKRAQNLAADKGFDQQVLKLIDVCVKVTARGFDGTNVRTEERHQKVCNLFKRLLITCLQFLHNFIMHNEHRKLVLWLDLFGNSQQAEALAGRELHMTPQKDARGQPIRMSVPDQGSLQPAPASQVTITTNNNGPHQAVIEQAPLEAFPATRSPEDVADDLQRSFRTQQQYLQDIQKDGLSYTISEVHELFDAMSGDEKIDSKTQAAAQVLMERIKKDMERLSGMSAEELDNNTEALLKVGAALRAQMPAVQSSSRGSEIGIGMSNSYNTMQSAQGPSDHWTGLPDLTSYEAFLSDQDITKDDLVMPRTPVSAADTLQEAKDELMARLQDTSMMSEEHPDDHSYHSGQAEIGDGEEDLQDSAEDSIEEDDEGEDGDNYENHNDQERGLLTDVPLVLGPTEIEALPMIIQAGIVDNFGPMKNGPEKQGTKNMQAVRCHILLAQEAGRNVLRELLIFIAAWDLPDDEFYFKMMVQIMEAILKNGLMSHAYSDFGQAKDIISPAQAVVIKILTHIFRSKYSPSNPNNDNLAARSKAPSPLTRVDVLTVRYIFTVFRGNIIPETCALIYLQGQIKSGLALAEDFPLNLWDMERVYEGVYQFLEFFAVLTENNDWKRLLVDWQIVYDLVTLLKELDASIPKAPLSASLPQSAANQIGSATASATLQPPSKHNSVAVERPYDPASSPQFSHAMLSVSGAPEKAMDLTPSPPPPPPTNPASPPPPAPSEDPSTFEWRNLKKLIVLVLSSLVWKSPTVQAQIRDNAGVETILRCTNYDGHNPYIKEHAVMCLKFLLEGNKENQEIITALEAKGISNEAKLAEEHGVHARLDERGKVKITPVAVPGAGPVNVRGANGNNPKDADTNASDRSRRRARRASESTAAAELVLGERFAKMSMGSDGAGAGLGTNSQNARGRFAGVGISDSTVDDGSRMDKDNSIRSLKDGDDDDDNGEIEFM